MKLRINALKFITILVVILVIVFSVFSMDTLPSYIKSSKEKNDLKFSWLIILIFELIANLFLLAGGLLAMFYKEIGRKLMLFTSVVMIFIYFPILTFIAYVLFGRNSFLGLISTFFRGAFYLTFLIYFSLPRVKELFKR